MTTIVLRDHPRGVEGVREGMREVAEGMDRDRYHPLLIEWVHRVLMMDPDTLLPRGRPDPTKIARALFDAIKRRVGFVRDPVDTELIMSSIALLCLDPKGLCIPSGDCDDQVRLLGAALLCAGVPVMLQNRFYNNQKSSHVVLHYDADPRLSGKWACFDPSLDSGVCSTAPYETEIRMEVHMGKREGGTFVGIGDPPPAMLSAQESAVWTDAIARTLDSTRASLANLKASRTALVAVRSDLGLPANDPEPSPGGGDTRNNPPLRQFGDTKQWTPTAQAAVMKLVSTGEFAASILAEALAGQRKLYFVDDPNVAIAIGAIGGEPYYLQMRKNADGIAVPSYIDPKTDQETGQMGNPIIVGLVVGAGAALTLAAAWNMDKIIDFIAQASHDAMLLIMQKFQADLISSGKATPDQLSKLQQANTHFAKASVLPKESGPSWGWILLALGIGIAGGILGARYAGPAVRHADRSIKRRIANKYGDDEDAAAGASRARLYAPGGAARAFAF